MKNYDNYNYSRYKADLKASMPEGKFWDEYENPSMKLGQDFIDKLGVSE